jgi:hypothetical protein
MAKVKPSWVPTKETAFEVCPVCDNAVPPSATVCVHVGCDAGFCDPLRAFELDMVRFRRTIGRIRAGVTRALRILDDVEGEGTGKSIFALEVTRDRVDGFSRELRDSVERLKRGLNDG